MINQTTSSFRREFFRIGARQAKRVMNGLSQKGDKAGGLGILSGLGRNEKARSTVHFRSGTLETAPKKGTKKCTKDSHDPLIPVARFSQPPPPPLPLKLYPFHTILPSTEQRQT